MVILWQASIRSKKPNTGSKAVVKPYSMDKKKTDRYEIPRGSWFEWVSSAHYFAEIVSSIFSVFRSTCYNIEISISMNEIAGVSMFSFYYPKPLLNGYI